MEEEDICRKGYLSGGTFYEGLAHQWMVHILTRSSLLTDIVLYQDHHSCQPFGYPKI